MKLVLRGPGVLLLLLVSAALFAACGKKGPPLPPLSRVPAPPGNPQIGRIGDEVYLWFTVPSANASGQIPADIDAIELYAVTAVEPPSGPDLTKAAVKIATYPVQTALPAPPAAVEAAPPRPPPAAAPGFVQGASAVVREVLTAAEVAPTRLPTPPAAPLATTEQDTAPRAGPLVGPTSASLRRYYFLVSTGRRGRASAPTALLSVPVESASDPPTGLHLEYTEGGMTLSWEAADNAYVAPAAGDPALLAAKPLFTPPAPTTYHVMEAPKGPAAPVDPFALTLPTMLTKAPVAVTTFAIPGPVRFGEERCFVVRSTDVVGGTPIVGRPSEPACVTPVDTFPPAAPTRLAAIAGVGVINLIWEPNTEADLAGYIVLRGTAPGGTLQALTPTPIRETTYRDQSATPGVRYVYAVVAVDNASPQNVSGQSNRVEDSSRTP